MRGATAIALLLLIPVRVDACSCSPIDLCRIVQQPIVFIGEVVEGGVAPWESPWYSNSTHVRLRVKENLHGLASGTQFFDLATLPTSGMCAPNVFHRGRTYLVIPHFYDGKYRESGCAGDRDVEHFADDVDYIRKYFGGRRQPAVRVFVGSQGDRAFRDLGVAGAKIVASRGGKSYSTVANEKGMGLLELPGGGSYAITAMLAPYRAAKGSVEAPETGCTAAAALNLASGNSVSGRIKGSGRVGLISLDLPPGQEGRPQVLETEASESDGAFQFRNVPVGRYLLKFNPDGPGMDYWRKESRESTYFPGSSDRARAKVIEFRSINVTLARMDFSAGPQVKLRNIRIMAVYRGGRPMLTARFRVTALANGPGTEDAFVSGLVTKGQPEFTRTMLPVDRRIRVELWDEYRPWLKRYVAEFPPGVSPIEHTFVTGMQ